MWSSKYALALVLACACPWTCAAPSISCPVAIKDGTHSYPLNYASLFDGPPAKLADLMPDSDKETVWTLPLYQKGAQDRGESLYFVCRYSKTGKTITLQVPKTAKKCSVYGDEKGRTTAVCK